METFHHRPQESPFFIFLPASRERYSDKYESVECLALDCISQPMQPIKPIEPTKQVGLPVPV